MAVHKMSDGPITMVVAGVKQTEGNFGPQFCFTAADGTDVYVSEMAGAKGLARMNLTPETVVGQTITIEQVKKDGKTYTNFSKGGTPGAPATRTTSTAAPAMAFDDLVALYAKCVEAAIQQLGKRCEQAEIPVDGAAIQAAAATLFIRGSK
ncbi:MAG: hypothetical protein ACO3ND_07705 [Opitutales bacterium]